MSRHVRSLFAASEISRKRARSNSQPARTRAAPSFGALNLRGEMKLAASDADQRAIAFGEWTERVFGRQGRDKLVDIARSPALFGLLHLEQVGRMDFAAVFAN